MAGTLDVLARGPTSPFADDGGHEVRNRPLWLLARILLGAPVLAYFAYFRRTGQTPGMDLAGTRLVTEDGRPPGAIRAIARSALTLAFAVAAFLAWFDVFAGRTSSTTPYRELYMDPPREVLSAAALVLFTWLLGVLAALLDGRRRTLWDRLVGLVQVDDAERTRRDERFDEWLRRRSS